MYEQFGYQVHGQLHQKEMLAEAEKWRLHRMLHQPRRRENNLYRVLRIHTGRSLIAAGQYLLKRAETPQPPVSLSSYAELR